jgi:hypothetical protein
MESAMPESAAVSVTKTKKIIEVLRLPEQRVKRRNPGVLEDVRSGIDDWQAMTRNKG